MKIVVQEVVLDDHPFYNHRISAFIDFKYKRPEDVFDIDAKERLIDEIVIEFKESLRRYYHIGHYKEEVGING